MDYGHEIHDLAHLTPEGLVVIIEQAMRDGYPVSVFGPTCIVLGFRPPPRDPVTPGYQCRIDSLFRFARGGIMRHAWL